ncbi:putative glycosyl [Golovinomyces cichoracearum]|uniref:Putative glycosyl n=1 Tax=Golovinomyces cichoracearum TaxID=62708 RepID=A0A420HN87_9PEZI|nr:putative glycosyl [Golovinomyces cichoracearum]
MKRYHQINEETERFPVYEIGNLTKMYRDEDRYNGTSDSFDLCLGIFYDVCLKTGVQQNFFKDAFSIMLKGSAREYYHLHLMNNGLSFQDMTQKLRAYFETAERQLQMISKSKSIMLMRTIGENPNKTVSECFELLVTEFRKTQLLLPSRFQGNLSLRDAVIDAVRDI